MALITPDVSEITPDLEVGTHRMRITDVVAGEWKTGTPYLNFTMETCEAAKPELNGRKFWHKVPYTGKGAFLFAKLHKAVIGEDYVNGEIDTEVYLGRDCPLVLDDGVDSRDGSPTGYLDAKAIKPVI